MENITNERIETVISATGVYLYHGVDFFCAYMLPIRDLCATAFCVLLSVVFLRKKIMRHYISYRA